MSYIYPPMGSGVTRQPNLNRIIARNVQFFSLADQGNSGLKMFLASVPSCNRIATEAVQTWYMLFTKMAATTRFYLHPYFCFQKHANSDYGFTCGFDVGPVGLVTVVAEVLHRPHVPAVLTVTHIPGDPASNVAEVVAVTAIPKVHEITHVPAVLAVPTINPV